MVNDGYADQGVMQAHKAVEQVMKGILRDGNVSSFDAISRLKSKGKLSAINVDRAHKLRKVRNDAAHGGGGIKPKEAKMLISGGRGVVSQLLK